MKQLLLLVVLCASSALCFNFNVSGVAEIHTSAANNSYFGYTLLLQKGNRDFQPIVIVGAPRQGSSEQGGSIYSCTEEGNCNKYQISPSSKYSQNGNFLGSALDGGDTVGESFITCAPRVATYYSKLYNFLYGLCFLKRNSSNFIGKEDATIDLLSRERPISFDPQYQKSYYDFAFAQAGFDVQYDYDKKSVLLGAPGIKNWNGALVVTDTQFLNRQIIPQKTSPLYADNFGYSGYKVTTARLDKDTSNIHYLVGTPRGSGLFGNVKIYTTTGYLQATLTGDEVGSYFGSAILTADLNNDQRDDVLVGAPTGAGVTWDEGYVYVYMKTSSKLEFSKKLFGSKKPGARFGSSIASLGDIDLDSYNDVAIAAPYEDNGIGAVYIYMGSKTGIQPIYSQRLSPSDFGGGAGFIRGFGQGLSKGVDVDGNGHNDLAIGAYKSDQVFLVRTLSIIDYRLTLEPNVTSISSNKMNLKVCVYFTQRSPTRDITNLQFSLKLLLDYRVNGDTTYKYTFDTPTSKPICKFLDIEIKNSPLDITPFKMALRSEIVRKDVIGKGESYIERSIPYSHGCGDDNICQTRILVEAMSNLPNIVLGLDKDVTVDINIDNVGEPGYGCKLHMIFSNVLELRNTRDCDLENSTYICPFSSRLERSKEINILFDIKLVNPEMDRVEFNFEVKCLGENLDGESNKKQLTLDVLLKNSPYIQGSSIPDSFYYTDENVEKDVEVVHSFRIGNTGPSPIKLDIFLALPTVKKDGVDIFEMDAKGCFNGIEVQCSPTKRNVSLENTYNISALLTEPLNKTVMIDCFEEHVECLVLFCDGNYLYKSTEIAEYNIKITTKTKLLASHYQNELVKKDILAFVSSAYIFNGTSRIEGHAATMIFSSKTKPIPIWVYIIAAVLGIVLLILLIVLLYKCHFFDRNYRDKLNDEKLMEGKADDNMDHMQAIDLNEDIFVNN